MNKLSLSILLPLLIVAILGYVFVIKGDGQKDVALQGGKYSSSCNVTTSSNVAIGDDISSSLLSAAANRAWAQIEIPANATDEFYLSFDEGAAAATGSGVLIASSSPSIAFGLNTDLPYTGAVTGITANATTTVLITECLY